MLISLKKDKSKGLTLIEVIVSLAIVVIVFSCITLMFKPVKATIINGVDASDVVSLREYLLNEITGEVRYAKNLSLNEEIDTSKCDDTKVCRYTKEGYLYKSNDELLFDKAFYDKYQIEMTFTLIKRMQVSLEIDLKIMDLNGNVLDQSSTAIELRNASPTMRSYPDNSKMLIFE